MKILTAIAGFLLGLIIFMPKDNIYFKIQEILSKKNIYINSDIKNSLALELKNGTVFVNKMDLAYFDRCEIYPYIFWNKIECNNINIANQYKITNINGSYSIINPFKIKISGNSNFGKIEGEINIFDKNGRIYITKLTNSLIKRYLKKDKKGYYYDVKF